MRRVSSLFGNYFNESNLKIAINAAGIFVFHFCYGVVQERIMIINRYGNELNRDGTRGERYTFAVALVGILSLAYCLFAKGEVTLHFNECLLISLVNFSDFDGEKGAKRYNTSGILL